MSNFSITYQGVTWDVEADLEIHSRHMEHRLAIQSVRLKDSDVDLIEFLSEDTLYKLEQALEEFLPEELAAAAEADAERRAEDFY